MSAAQVYVSLAEDSKLKYEVYTAHKHTYVDYKGENPEERLAVGMTDGPVAVDGTEAPAEDKAVREVHFPLAVATTALATNLQGAKASQEDDRRRILNTIVGRSDELLAMPLASHPKYDELNNTLRGRFAAATLGPLLKAEKPIEVCLKALRSSGMRALSLNFKGCPGFSAAATQVFESLPEGVVALDLTRAGIESAGVQLAAALPKYKSLTKLE